MNETEAATVRLLLDVDGVLNAFRYEQNPPNPDWTEWRVAGCKGYRITHALDMAAELRATGVEVHWLTTWGRSANEWIAPLFEWEELPVVAEMPFREKAGWWKLDAAKIWLAANPGPFAWADDDLRFEPDAVEWCLKNGGLPLMPCTELGLTRAHIQELQEYCNG